MSGLTCKCCGARSVRLRGVQWDDDTEIKRWVCPVCGDNWETNKVARDGVVRITFLHQAERHPPLVRMAEMVGGVTLEDLFVEANVDAWAYWIGSRQLVPGEEEVWFKLLRARRHAIKAAVCN